MIEVTLHHAFPHFKLDVSFRVKAGLQEAIFRHPATLRLARAVDMRNLFPVTVEGHGLHTTRLRWAAGTLQAPRVALPPGTRVWAGIRPEDVLFVRDARPLSSTHNLVDAEVAEVRPAAIPPWCA